MGSRSGQDVGELFQKHGAIVYQRALRLLGRQADADDAVQEVFIRAMRGLATFESRSSMSLWLSQITVHYCLDVLRQRSRRRLLLEQNVATPEDRQPGAAATDLVLLRQLLSESDEQQAKAVVYVYLDDMSHEQAAELLGVSKRTVGNLIEHFLAWAQKRSASTLTKLPEPTPLHVIKSDKAT
jgi:RNA polymerase sigma-70 factor (ECF subfamily)